jgi:hypothetical protein
MIPRDEVDERVRANVEATIEHRLQEADPGRRRLVARAELLDLLEAKLGVSIYGITQLDAIARAYQLVTTVDAMKWSLQRLEAAGDTASQLAKDVRAALRKIREVEQAPRTGT